MAHFISQLAELCTTRLKELGGIIPDRVHTPHLQERILSQIPWMKGLKAGKKLYIACEAAVEKTAARELHQNPDQDLCDMVRTAIHLREHIFDLQQRFDGEFAGNMQKKSVPPIYCHSLARYCVALHWCGTRSQRLMIGCLWHYRSLSCLSTML